MARRGSYSETPRKRLSGEKLQKLRQQVFTHYGDQCWLCGGGGADTIDHIIPVADGGDEAEQDRDTPANGVQRRQRRLELSQGRGPRSRS